MKKMLFGLIAVIAFGLNANAENSEKESSKKEITDSNKTEEDDLLKIKIHIEWGRKSKGCEGFGICSTDIDIDAQLSDAAFFGRANANGNLVLEVTKIGMESINKRFSSNTIILEEDFILSDDVCKSLGLKTGYTIKQGKYTVKTDSSGLTTVIL